MEQASNAFKLIGASNHDNVSYPNDHDLYNVADPGVNVTTPTSSLTSTEECDHGENCWWIPAVCLAISLVLVILTNKLIDRCMERRNRATGRPGVVDVSSGGAGDPPPRNQTEATTLILSKGETPADPTDGGNDTNAGSDVGGGSSSGGQVLASDKAYWEGDQGTHHCPLHPDAACGCAALSLPQQTDAANVDYRNSLIKYSDLKYIDESEDELEEEMPGQGVEESPATASSVSREPQNVSREQQNVSWGQQETGDFNSPEREKRLQIGWDLWYNKYSPLLKSYMHPKIYSGIKALSERLLETSSSKAPSAPHLVSHLGTVLNPPLPPHRSWPQMSKENALIPFPIKLDLSPLPGMNWPDSSSGSSLLGASYNPEDSFELDSDENPEDMGPLNNPDFDLSLGLQDPYVNPGNVGVPNNPDPNLPAPVAHPNNNPQPNFPDLAVNDDNMGAAGYDDDGAVGGLQHVPMDISSESLATTSESEPETNRYQALQNDPDVPHDPDNAL